MDDFDTPSRSRMQIEALERERDAAGHGGNGWADMGDAGPGYAVPALVALLIAFAALAAVLLFGVR